MKLHPRNREFRWRAPAPPYRRITPAQARAWDEQGGFLLEAAFTPAEVGAVLAEIDPIDAQVSAFLETRPGGKLFIAEKGNITFAPNLVLRSKALARFCAHRVFADLCHDLIGRGCAALLGLVRLQEAREAGHLPVASGQRLHRREKKTLG